MCHMLLCINDFVHMYCCCLPGSATDSVQLAVHALTTSVGANAESTAPQPHPRAPHLPPHASHYRRHQVSRYCLIAFSTLACLIHRCKDAHLKTR